MQIKETINLVLKSSDSHPYVGKLSPEENRKAAIALSELFRDFAKDGHAEEAMNLPVEHWEEVINQLKTSNG